MSSYDEQAHLWVWCTTNLATTHILTHKSQMCFHLLDMWAVFCDVSHGNPEQIPWIILDILRSYWFWAYALPGRAIPWYQLNKKPNNHIRTHFGDSKKTKNKKQETMESERTGSKNSIGAWAVRLRGWQWGWVFAARSWNNFRPNIFNIHHILCWIKRAHGGLCLNQSFGSGKNGFSPNCLSNSTQNNTKRERERENKSQFQNW